MKSKSKLQPQKVFVNEEIKDFHQNLRHEELIVLLTLDYLANFDLVVSTSSLHRIIKEIGLELTYEEIEQKIEILVKNGYYNESPVLYVI